MVKVSDVKLYRRGVQKLLKSDGLEAYLLRLAKKVETQAVSTAPRGDTGQYAGSIQATTVTNPSRVVGRVYARAPHAHKVEALYGTLGRALDAAGR